MQNLSWMSAILGGLTGALLTQLATWLREGWNRRQDSRFAAMQLALLLDEYTANCAEQIADTEDYLSNSQHVSAPGGGVPSLPDSIDKTPWRLLGFRIMSDTMSLRVAVATTSGSLDADWMHSEKMDWLSDCSDGALALGLRANQVADDIYRRFGLKRPPPPNGLPHFDVPKFLADHQGKRAVQRARYEESLAKSHAELMSTLTPTAGPPDE